MNEAEPRDPKIIRRQGYAPNPLHLRQSHARQGEADESRDRIGHLAVLGHGIHRVSVGTDGVAAELGKMGSPYKGRNEQALPMVFPDGKVPENIYAIPKKSK